MKLLIATKNSGKVSEFREMLDAKKYQCSDLRAFPDAADVEETGHTFRTNACIKASAYALRHDQWALADDSGLEVNALAQKPGVHSARWATVHNAGAGDADNNALVLAQLKSTTSPDRSARFVCVLALSDPSGKIILTSRATLEGRILDAPRGDNGFGYDPLFFLEEFGKTTAQLTADEKNAISHRGKALQSMCELMKFALPDSVTRL